MEPPIKDWEQSYSKYLRIAGEAHEGTQRQYFRKGQKIVVPYLEHPRNVAQILKNEGCHCYQIAAAFLHDVLEDTDWTEEDLRSSEVEEEVISLVKAVTKVFDPNKDKTEQLKAYYEAMSMSATYVKLADRYDNLISAAVSWSPERIVKYSRETVEIMLEATPFRSLSLFFGGGEKLPLYLSTKMLAETLLTKFGPLLSEENL